jgi:hypothetical protein
MPDTAEIIQELTGRPDAAEPQFTVNFPEVNLGLIPGRGFLYSFLLYAVVIPALIYLPVPRTIPYQGLPEQWHVTMLPKDVIFLPQLGGGSAGGITAGKSAESPETARPSSVPARSKVGVSYPGAQPIVSNPPHPTNHVQTILQPALQKPPVLNRFVPLPNIVKVVALSASHTLPGSLDAPEPAPTPKPPDDRSSQAMLSVQMPILPTGVTTPVEHPELTMPPEAPPAPTDVPIQALLKPLVRVVPPRPKQVHAEPEVLPGEHGRDLRNLLVLSATPAPPGTKTMVPQAEARGQFAITTLPLLAMTNVGPGSEAAQASASSVAVGKHPENTVRDAAGGEHESAGAGSVPLPGGGKLGAASKEAGGGGGPTPTASAGIGGAAAGNSAGAAAGGGFGISIASGSGSGAGAGNGAFAGITIQGGEQSPGENAGQAAGGPAHGSQAVQFGSYNMTIVSNGNSGGGLKDYGVFAGQQVFTVFISMNTSPRDPAASWTMEYGQMPGPADPPGSLEPPFPLNKAFPHWPAGLPDRYHGQSVVVNAVMSREGRLLNMRIMQTPNPALNPALFTALHHWVFRPARVDGKPVAVEVLFGVPL